jgi:hypothetical protein
LTKNLELVSAGGAEMKTNFQKATDWFLALGL